MEKSLGQKRTGTERRWDAKHTAYKCTDCGDVHIRQILRKEKPVQKGSGKAPDQAAPASMIGYCINARRRKAQVQVFASGAELSRDISQLARGASDARTVTFSKGVLRLRDRVFADSEQLRSVVLNEGLETLGEYQGPNCRGAFRGTKLRSVAVPKTVRLLGDHTFQACAELKCVTFAEGSALEKIGELCFSGSGLEELVLPMALKQVAGSAFSDCGSLRKITAEEGCAANLSDIKVPASARAGQQVSRGRICISELQKLRDVAIPDGVERIERSWFQTSNVRSVEVSVSIRAIADGAFQECRDLRRVSFAFGSQLETMGVRCFCDSGLRDLVVPRSVVTIGDAAFAGCGVLKRVVLHEYGRLESIGKDCFSGCGIGEFVAP